MPPQGGNSAPFQPHCNDMKTLPVYARHTCSAEPGTYRHQSASSSLRALPCMVICRHGQCPSLPPLTSSSSSPSSSCTWVEGKEYPSSSHRNLKVAPTIMFIRVSSISVLLHHLHHHSHACMMKRLLVTSFRTVPAALVNGLGLRQQFQSG